MAPLGEDDTVRLRPAASRTRPHWLALTAGAAALLLVLALGALLLRPAPAPAPEAAHTAPPALGTPSPPPVVAPAPPPRPMAALASEAEILAGRAPELAIRFLAENPSVLVLDFPTLGEQARMLNRIAALVEKIGLPRDRVLNDAELDEAVRAGGTTAETFYYGHNYRAADLARFFALADRDGIRLNAEEERLRALLRDLGWLRPDAAGALVSLPHAGVEPWLDMRARAAMLRHELSHGEFFTNPAYAAHVWRFWREMLTEAERAAFRHVLAHASYDPSVEEVMANEAQAFLFHTPDERFFRPADAGLSPARVAELRAAFIATMPPGWLREAMKR